MRSRARTAALLLCLLVSWLDGSSAAADDEGATREPMKFFGRKRSKPTEILPNATTSANDTADGKPRETIAHVSREARPSAFLSTTAHRVAP